MFNGLSFDKLLLVAVIAVFLIGPTKLPTYASKLATLVRTVRDYANGAKARMKDEMGPEFDEVDWKKLDPRQYDPRRIIREALLDDTPAPAAIRPVEKTETVSPPADDQSPKQDQAEAGVAAMKLAAGSVEGSAVAGPAVVGSALDGSAVDGSETTPVDATALADESETAAAMAGAGPTVAVGAPVTVPAGARTSPYDSEAT